MPFVNLIDTVLKLLDLLAAAFTLGFQDEVALLQRAIPLVESHFRSLGKECVGTNEPG